MTAARDNRTSWTSAPGYARPANVPPAPSARQPAHSERRLIAVVGDMADRGGELGDGCTEVNRDSLSGPLDMYDPEQDVVAPISLRTSFMELLWVCGDCGEHYARAQTCPEECGSCGAPKQNFYAPTED